MNSKTNNGRRKFIKTTGAVAGVTIIPSKSVWGACNASGVSGGSQALENVCRAGAQEFDDSVMPGGFPPSDFTTLFTSVNNNGVAKNNARKVIGAMFTKNSWLDESGAIGFPFTNPVFRYDGGRKVTTLIGGGGRIKDDGLKALLASKGVSGERVTDQHIPLLKDILDRSSVWHLNELNALKQKLEMYASETLFYVSGVDEFGKAIISELNVLSALKGNDGRAVKLIAALFLNLEAGFCQGPIGITPKEYCEQLLAVVLETVASPSGVSNLIDRIEDKFDSPVAKEASSFLA